ncbi:MAG: hypothetical protein NTX03_09615 [Bacteroidetes bacterium]|nr:hypothetical protein [Bacteroidota bacterium]
MFILAAYYHNFYFSPGGMSEQWEKAIDIVGLIFIAYVAFRVWQELKKPDDYKD